MSSEESREDPGDHTEDNIFQSQWQCKSTWLFKKTNNFCKWKKPTPRHEHWDPGRLRVALAESKPLPSVLM